MTSLTRFLRLLCSENAPAEQAIGDTPRTDDETPNQSISFDANRFRRSIWV